MSVLLIVKARLVTIGIRRGEDWSQSCGIELELEVFV